MTEITSSSNPQFRIWRSLLTTKGIKSEGLFLLSGEKLIREFLKTSHFEIVAELMTDRHMPQQSQAPVFELKKDLFQELDLIGTHFNLLVLKTKLLGSSNLKDPFDGLEMIIPVGDPNNLGALIRSCVAFGVKRIHLTQESANPYHPKCVKASAGAVLKAPLSQSGPLVEWDHESVFALSSEGLRLTDLPRPPRARILVGEEGPGLPKGLQHVKRLSIPTEQVESLNATVAASLVLWHWSH